MLGLLVAFLWFLIELVVIWGGAYIVKVIVDWIPFIPGPIKVIIWYVVLGAAIILSIIALIMLISGEPMPAFR